MSNIKVIITDAPLNGSDKFIVENNIVTSYVIPDKVSRIFINDEGEVSTEDLTILDFVSEGDPEDGRFIGNCIYMTLLEPRSKKAHVIVLDGSSDNLYYYIFFKYNEEISPIPLEDTEDNKMLFYRILNNMIRKNDEFKYLAQLVAIRNEKGEFFVVHDDYKYEMMDYYLLERIDNVKPII